MVSNRVADIGGDLRVKRFRCPTEGDVRAVSLTDAPSKPLAAIRVLNSCKGTNGEQRYES
jgi:hypothetical protein